MLVAPWRDGDASAERRESELWEQRGGGLREPRVCGAFVQRSAGAADISFFSCNCCAHAACCTVVVSVCIICRVSCVHSRDVLQSGCEFCLSS